MKKYKMIIMIAFIWAFKANAQSNYHSRLIIEGNKTLVLSAVGTRGQGKLSTGEIVSTGCDHGACYFSINYNGRRIGETLGENFRACLKFIQ